MIYRSDVTTSSAWWLKEGRLQAAFVLNRPDEERELAPQWIKGRQSIEASMLRDSKSPLRQLKAA